MSDVRATALDLLNEVKAKVPISSKASSADFEKYTGYSQASLEETWKTQPTLTCCNAFVNWYSRELARKLGSTVLPLGNFSTEGWLAHNQKHHAWVQAREGAMPLPGDIYRPRSFHMGVVYSCENPGTFRSIDAGQGGRPIGQDIIKLLERPFDIEKFLGWVDIEKLYGPAPPQQPVPAWLPGWWEVTVQGRKLWYHFGTDRKVTRTNSKPATSSSPPFGGETVQFSIEFGSIAILSWPKKGGHFEVEKFSPHPFTDNRQLDGDRDGVIPLTAHR